MFANNFSSVANQAKALLQNHSANLAFGANLSSNYPHTITPLTITTIICCC
jgi:hypothetical protein